LKGNIKQSAIAISLIKGLSSNATQGLRLISEEIRESLGTEVAVLMGANLAPEVANDSFCEATIGIDLGSKSLSAGQMLKNLFHTDNFRISVVRDANTVELCGALKNVVACAAGFSDGLSYGDNTKAAIIRLGLKEMMNYIEHFYPGSDVHTYFESCGVADLITTCYGGRNRKVCEAFVKGNKPLKQIEAELLNGQSAQGPLTAEELYPTLKDSNLLAKYPLFVAVHRICQGEVPANQFIDLIRDHPEYK
jgi:glycerol-3-phosphate dehydrogenase (NAD+)